MERPSLQRKFSNETLFSMGLCYIFQIIGLASTIQIPQPSTVSHYKTINLSIQVVSCDFFNRNEKKNSFRPFFPMENYFYWSYDVTSLAIWL